MVFENRPTVEAGEIKTFGFFFIWDTLYVLIDIYTYAFPFKL